MRLKEKGKGRIENALLCYINNSKNLSEVGRERHQNLTLCRKGHIDGGQDVNWKDCTWESYDIAC